MNELVSIVMPVYNASEFISDAILSVINQTYENWELIVVNDCSRDNSLEIINEFTRKDSRIKLIDLKINSGVYYARNCGIQKAEGKYLAFLDSDDMWDKSKLTKQVNLMYEKDILFSFTGYRMVDHKGNYLDQIIKVPKKIKYKDLLNVNYIGCLTVMVNIHRLGKFQMPNIRHEDYATWLSILKENRIEAYGLNEVLASYRKTATSLSSNKIKTIGWTWNIYNNHLKMSVIESGYRIVKFGFNTLRKYKNASNKKK
ncbi:glycosyltransferase family 2 protein [Bacillus sp. Cr_A10]|uniref:glycosyltransferase family 2 protein n=1 Tax=Bacillus sp. Cr_A10 TaxID=3033993 RepID=UPI0023DB0FD2|nr:glycosyltransferase family 2 protein [Bacillus sp. Cr_A10]MDF2068167.1 glycosyltransferase family 2 protein [Bacillus sp. Cr_A10]